MNDLDRWVNLEGPPPDGVRELLDVACDVPPMTPELEERLDRKLYTALAADRRQRARLRTIKLALGGGLLAACFACGIVLALRAAVPPSADAARERPPSEAEPIPTQLAATKAPAPPPSALPPAVSATSPQPNTGPVRRPKTSSGVSPPR